jgi:hypothetical protein
MALIRVAQYSSTPTVVGDYQAQNAHLQAFTNQLMTQQFILDSGLAQPIIKQGCYVSHGGSLYVADADTPITGSPSDGNVYIRVSGTTSLTVEFVTDISGYAWNPVYTALTNGSYTLLPYLIVKAYTFWARYNFNPNEQQFGSLASLVVNGNATVGGALGVTGAINGASIGVSGLISGASVDTGQGATEVHLMNQNLRTTDSPTFATVNATDVVTTNGPNKPVDNNDASMPSVGIGGFSYAVGSTSTNGAFPSITIGSGGTWVYVAQSGSSESPTKTITKIGRVAGGSTIQGLIAADSSSNGLLYVVAWRIA